MVFGWFAFFIIFLIIELLSNRVVTLWFAIGSMVAMVSTVYTSSILYQFAVFFVSSIIAKLIIEKSVKTLQSKIDKAKRKTSRKRKTTNNSKKKGTSSTKRKKK